MDEEEALFDRLDELRIWNIVRSESEIRFDMSRRLIGDEPGLVGYWRLDEGEGRDAEDSTGYNDAVLNFERWCEHVGVDVCPCFREPVWLCDVDVDGDGQVNPVDSGLVQAAFGSPREQVLCNYDVDCDGRINPVDAGIVQSLFGTCEEPRRVCP